MANRLKIILILSEIPHQNMKSQMQRIQNNETYNNEKCKKSSAKIAKLNKRIIKAEKLERDIRNYEGMVEGGKMTLGGYKKILYDVADVLTEMERSLKDNVDRTVVNNAIDMIKDEEEEHLSTCGNVFSDKCVIF